MHSENDEDYLPCLANRLRCVPQPARTRFDWERYSDLAPPGAVLIL